MCVCMWLEGSKLSKQTEIEAVIPACNSPTVCLSVCLPASLSDSALFLM